MSNKRDYYEVPEGCKECKRRRDKKAYRKKQLYHPDRNQDETAEEKFKEAAEAYEVLRSNKDHDMINLVMQVWRSCWRRAWVEVCLWMIYFHSLEISLEVSVVWRLWWRTRRWS